MEIAVLGECIKLRKEIELSILFCLPDNHPYILRQYGLEEAKARSTSPSLAAAFVILDEAFDFALHALATIAYWDENLPLVIICDIPGFALEGIRLPVQHYLTLPLEEDEMRKALLSTGLGSSAILNVS